MIPARGKLLVKPVETEESLGAIILIADTRERMTMGQCEVIAVGVASECDPTRSKAERKCERMHAYDTRDERKHWRRVHPHAARVGDWLLVRPRSFIDSPRPEAREWFIHQDDVIAILGRGDDSHA